MKLERYEHMVTLYNQWVNLAQRIASIIEASKKWDVEKVIDSLTQFTDINGSLYVRVTQTLKVLSIR
jgi:hypothetical protein